ncbi:sulfotransferase domain-containing protein [Salinimicrobium oceani]|uniref:Sulfotransferase domain-containing protein n=1 Tax=Salinimicrobium oceani TaxID=2722702 RepID=A0ABX1CYU1_9FLAO|nr:sulfotransferase domain-containing protein [Salinimicrobium oceani]NJW53115.1 sulfotransferase domain-containing protein [Salinimicrobium oceani]
MNILQVSAPKSGSFWLNTILRKSLRSSGIKITHYIKTLPEYEMLKKQQLSFKGQAGVDMMDIEEEEVYFRVSSIFKKPIPELTEYAQRASLAWTHSTWCNRTASVFSFFDKKICIVRDPRDTALSAARFAFTPYMKAHYPSSYNSVEEYFSAEYERLMEQWVWFYGNYLLRKEELDLHFIFYENLLHNFQQEFDALLQYLELDLPIEVKSRIQHEVSFSTMKEESPGHLHKGRSKKWMQHLSSEQIKIASNIAGSLMDIFGYAAGTEEADTLPRVPAEIPKKRLQTILETIDWKNLY